MPDLHRQIARWRAYLPLRSNWAIGRKLVARANADRDARLFSSATALYEQALRLVPGEPHFTIQYAHSRKDAGDYAAAEALYFEAQKQLPANPDLAMQLGHLYKLAGRTEDAERAYQRAITLRPGWDEPRRHLLTLGSAPAPSPRFDESQVVGELLPAPVEPSVTRDGFHMLRLGAAPVWTRGAYRRSLRGVEAIRGYVIHPSPLDELVLVLDGQPIRQVRLSASPHGTGTQYKHVFNIWHDFGTVPPGPHEVLLRAGSHRRRAELDVVPPLAAANAPDCDAVVDGAPLEEGSLETVVNARPSMIRPARRSALPHPVRSILVQRVDQLGDLACSVPALLRLRARFPEARIVGLLSPGNQALAARFGLFDDIVVADFPEDAADGGRSMTRETQAALRDRLAHFRFDVAVDLAETAGSRPLLRLSGARFLYGFRSEEFRWLDGGLDLHVRDPANRAERSPPAMRLVALVESLAAIASYEHDVLDLPSGLNEVAARYGLPEGARYVLLHTGARLAYSRWPGFAELAGLILAETSAWVLVMGDEAPADWPPSSRIVPATGLLPFHDFDALIAGAAAFVGNDSGPKHLAALGGVPAVSLHMARLNWNEWGQTGDGLIISRRVPCAGCGIGGAGDECGKDFACIRDIRPAEVMSAVHQLLRTSEQDGGQRS